MVPCHPCLDSNTSGRIAHTSCCKFLVLSDMMDVYLLWGYNSVLPPPPKYPTITTGINGATGLPIHSLDTNNSLAHPSGPEYQLVVGEGAILALCAEIR